MIDKSRFSAKFNFIARVAETFMHLGSVFNMLNMAMMDSFLIQWAVGKGTQNIMSWVHN